MLSPPEDAPPGDLRDFARHVLPAAMGERFPRLAALSARLNADPRIAGTRFAG